MPNKDQGVFSISGSGGGKSGSGYKLISLELSMTQNYDPSNKPSGLPRLQSVTVVVKAQNDTAFFDWMKTPLAEKNCNIEIPLSESVVRKIQLKKAYCIHYSERWDSYSSSAYLYTLGIIAKEISINDVTYKSQSET